VQAQILALIDELKTRLGLTCLFISHDLTVVGHISDRVAVMYLGSVVETGPTHEIVARPLHPYTKALLEAAPIFGERHHLPLLPGETPLSQEGLPGCPFHTRCPRVQGICTSGNPPLSQVEPGRFTACHIYS